MRSEYSFIDYLDWMGVNIASCMVRRFGEFALILD